jgi:tRNA(His) 5'-end guanylyltransferase
MDNSALAKRMKDYESTSKTRLMKRCPVCIRIDGKAFHSFTKNFNRPFDDVLIKAMQETTKFLCENIQGCVLGYTQSDEISLILIDYKELNTTPYFDYEVQKLCSISASMATMAFNRFFVDNCHEWYHNVPIEDFENGSERLDRLFKAYTIAFEKGAMFDSRCFNIPKEEVTNLIYWRQLDATRNSIQMVGQANFSHNELHGKSCNMIQDMLMTQKGINWNDFPTHQKRGTCVIKDYTTTIAASIDEQGNSVTNYAQRPHWVIDTEIPIFKGEVGRDYIDRLIRVGCECQCKMPTAYIN